MTDALAELELFKGLPNTVLEPISDLCREGAFAAGSVIFAEGRRASHMYVLLEGKVALTVSPTSLPEPMTISLLKNSGQPFGWSAVVGSGYYTASAHAETAVRAIAIDGPALVGHLEGHPCEGFVVMRRVAQVVSYRLGTIRTLLLETVCD
jgi:CRP-like cAMP-binding protein